MKENAWALDVSGAGLLLRGPPLSPGVVRGVGTTSRDTLPRAPLSVVGPPRPSGRYWMGNGSICLVGRRARLGHLRGPARTRAWPGPRALPGPACPSRARPARFAGPGLPLPGRSAQISRPRSEAGPARRKPGNRPGKTSCPGPSAAHRPARSLTAGPGQEGLQGPFCARRARGEDGFSIVFDDVEQCSTSSNASGEWP